MDIEALGLPHRHIIVHVLRMLGAEGLMRCLQKIRVHRVPCGP